MRFAISGDPVSAFDMNAQTTFEAPNFEKVDPTLGLHTMGGYSNRSKPMDFIKSGIQAAVVGKSLTIIWKIYKRLMMFNKYYKKDIIIPKNKQNNIKN